MPAIAALGVLDAVLIAIMAALVIWALRPVFVALIGALGSLPLVGAFIAGRVGTLADAALGGIYGWAQQGLSPLTDAVRRFNALFVYFNETAEQTIRETVSALWRVRYLDLPAFQRATVDLAYQLHGQALAYATQVGVDAGNYAQALFQRATDFTTRVEVAAAALAYALHGQALDYATQISHALQALIAARFGQAIDQADRVGAQAEGYAQALQRQAIDYTDQRAGQAIGFAERVGADAEGYAQALQRQAIDYAGHIGAQAEAYALALAVPIAAAVTAIERSPCQRFCSPLGDLGQLLQGLEDLGVLALFVGLAAEMAHDPQGTAKEIRQLAGPVLDEALSGLRAEAGVGG